MQKNKAHILVVDDDERICQLIGEFLQKNELRVSTAASVAQARRKMKSLVFDLLVLDVMMPEETGLSFAKELTAKPLAERPPILMLTALSKTEERIEGLEQGADDYLAKPFDPKELLLRIQKLLARALPAADPATPIKLGDFTFENAILSHQGKRVALSTGEEKLLSMLAVRAHQVVSRETLAKLCHLENERAVDVRINRLRQKIELAPNKPLFLQTVRGEGYILKPE